MKDTLGLGAWARGRSQLLATAALTAGLWTLVALGAGGGILAAIRPAPKAKAVVIPEPTTGAEGVAQLYVASWLRYSAATPGDLAAYYPAPIDAGETYTPYTTSTVPALRVARTAAVEARLLAPGYWSVLVAAEVSGETTATRWFRVGVVRAAGVFVASSLPAEVAAPLGARVPTLAAGDARRPEAGDAVGIAVSRFLAALLTGQGDLAVYTAPGSAIRAVRPAPYLTVTVLDVASRPVTGTPRTIEVVATATATDAGGRVAALSYPLTLIQRDKRWEVAAILAAPTLAAEQDRLVTTTTVALATTTTSTTTTTTTRPPGTTTSTTTAGATTTTRRI